jgi:hypothetical protein
VPGGPVEVGEGVRRAAGGVQRAHQRRGGRLVQRVLVGELGQPGDRRRGVARADLGVRPRHDGRRVLLAQRAAGAFRPVATQTGQWFATPQAQRGTQGRAVGAAAQRVAEAEQVDLVGPDVEAVAARIPHQVRPSRLGLLERPADAGDVRLQGMADLLGRGRTPDPVHEGVDADGGAGREQQHREHRLLARLADRHDVPVRCIVGRCFRHHNTSARTAGDGSVVVVAPEKATTQRPGEVLDEVLRALAGDPCLVDEVVEAARAASPEVARLPEAENRRHIAMVVAAAIAVAEHGGPEELGDEVFGAAEALGADRAAQGIPVEALLRGVHAGRVRAVDIAVDRARAAGVAPEAMLDALVRFTRYAGALERHVISGHRRAELELSRTARDAHTHVLRHLLQGTGELPDDEISRAGLRPDGHYHCVLSDVSDPVRARSLEQRLAGFGGVYGLVEGRLAGLSPRAPEELTDALVVVAPAATLTEVRARYRLCLTALAAVRDRRGVHHLVDLAGETALAAQPVLAELLAQRYLAPLDPADPFHRQLVSTGLAYLDHGQRVDQTAEALHVHPNTVRYRLGKLGELTGAGPAPTTVLHTLRWWWALTTWLR